MDRTLADKFDESGQSTVYLSFNSDETTYKTIEDVSLDKDISNEYVDDLLAHLHLRTMDPNKTLEAEPPSKGTVQVKVINNVTVEQISPLRPFDKNILNQHNGMCSTPSKEQIIATISKPNGVMNMLKEIANITERNIEIVEEANKENIQSTTDLSDGSTLSSSVDVTSSTLECKTLLITPSSEEPELESSKLIESVTPKVCFSQNTKMKETQTNTLKAKRSLLPRKSYGTSIIVKTTLNSPARRIANKLLPLGTDQKPRRSIMPGKKTTSGPTNLLRKSFIPTTKLEPPPVYFNTRPSLYQSSTEQRSAKPARPSIAEASNKMRQNLSIDYKCVTCGATFRIKSLLDAHKRSHESDSQPPTFVKKTITTQVSVAQNSQRNNKCKFCDKKFALERALHIHLMQNCLKIPPSQKRKLQFTELNHVEKAQLPGFGHVQSVLSPVTTPISSENGKTKSQMPPPSSAVKRSVKKERSKIPHAGVYRTPTKSVPCHICKQSFKSILDYTNHCLTIHSMNKQPKEQEALSADD